MSTNGLQLVAISNVSKQLSRDYSTLTAMATNPAELSKLVPYIQITDVDSGRLLYDNQTYLHNQSFNYDDVVLDLIDVNLEVGKNGYPSLIGGSIQFKILNASKFITPDNQIKIPSLFGLLSYKNIKFGWAGSNFAKLDEDVIEIKFDTSEDVQTNLTVNMEIGSPLMYFNKIENAQLNDLKNTGIFNTKPGYTFSLSYNGKIDLNDQIVENLTNMIFNYPDYLRFFDNISSQPINSTKRKFEDDLYGFPHYYSPYRTDGGYVIYSDSQRNDSDFYRYDGNGTYLHVWYGNRVKFDTLGEQELSDTKETWISPKLFTYSNVFDSLTKTTSRDRLNKLFTESDNNLWANLYNATDSIDRLVDNKYYSEYVYNRDRSPLNDEHQQVTEKIIETHLRYIIELRKIYTEEYPQRNATPIKIKNRIRDVYKKLKEEILTDESILQNLRPKSVDMGKYFYSEIPPISYKLKDDEVDKLDAFIKPSLTKVGAYLLLPFYYWIDFSRRIAPITTGALFRFLGDDEKTSSESFSIDREDISNLDEISYVSLVTLLELHYNTSIPYNENIFLSDTWKTLIDSFDDVSNNNSLPISIKNRLYTIESCMISLANLIQRQSGGNSISNWDDSYDVIMTNTPLDRGVLRLIEQAEDNEPVEDLDTEKLALFNEYKLGNVVRLGDIVNKWNIILQDSLKQEYAIQLSLYDKTPSLPDRPYEISWGDPKKTIGMLREEETQNETDTAIIGNLSIPKTVLDTVVEHNDTLMGMLRGIFAHFRKFNINLEFSVHRSSGITYLEIFCVDLITVAIRNWNGDMNFSNLRATLGSSFIVLDYKVRNSIIKGINAQTKTQDDLFLAFMPGQSPDSIVSMFGTAVTIYGELQSDKLKKHVYDNLVKIYSKIFNEPPPPGNLQERFEGMFHNVQKFNNSNKLATLLTENAGFNSDPEYMEALAKFYNATGTFPAHLLFGGYTINLELLGLNGFASFQVIGLRNTGLYDGIYMITSAKHKISKSEFTTNLECKLLVPRINSFKQQDREVIQDTT